MFGFRLSDYDCVGFDLDNTIAMYNVANMVEMEYNVIAKFLVEEKNYDADCLYQPLDKSDNFLQKGLILDFDRGNILRISDDGVIRMGSHGTKLLSTSEIEKIYPEKRWEALNVFTKNPFDTWNGPWSQKFRCLMDYFDMPVSLIFGRIVNYMDMKNEGIPEYNKIWPDIMDALIYMFDRTHFKMNVGDFFTNLKKQPEKYINKCSERVINWIRKIKNEKITFLITGSNADYADFIARYAIGEDWRSLFDIVICYAKKPGFFTENRPFLSLSEFEENEIVTGKQLERGGIYSQGNWAELIEFFGRIGTTNSPDCLYFGDNMFQDIYAPNVSIGWDTVVVSEELEAEFVNSNRQDPNGNTLISKIWGSYFSINVSGKIYRSFSTHIFENYSKMCVPSIESLTYEPIDNMYEAFDKKSKKEHGYYPYKPACLPTL